MTAFKKLRAQFLGVINAKNSGSKNTQKFYIAHLCNTHTHTHTYTHTHTHTHTHTTHTHTHTHTHTRTHTHTHTHTPIMQIYIIIIMQHVGVKKKYIIQVVIKKVIFYDELLSI